MRSASGRSSLHSGAAVLAAALAVSGCARGDEIKKMLGGNFRRVFARVCGR